MRPIPFEQYKVTPKPQIDNSAYLEYKEDKIFRNIRFWGLIIAVLSVLGYAAYRLIKLYIFGG